MGLKDILGQKIMNEVIIQKKEDRPIGINWRVLVLDKLGTKIMSTCCKMHDIVSKGITLVEDLEKAREPVNYLEAVYLIGPSQKSISALINDFADRGNPMYKAAHVFFTERCEDELFSQLCKSFVAKKIKTLKEIEIAFLPYEQQVYTLDYPETFQYYYNPIPVTRQLESMVRIAEQIVTVCATLGEYPSVRFRKAFRNNVDLALIVQNKLDAFKEIEPKLGEGPEKDRSQLIILDRGFDCISVLLHELSFQGMVYDLLPIKNDIYKYETTEGLKEVILDDNDEFWTELKHQHIARVSTIITNYLKTFIGSNSISVADESNPSLHELKDMMKQKPQFVKELTKYATYMKLAESCMKYYQNNVDRLCKVEQELAMGTDAESVKIKDQMKGVLPILIDKKISNNDKMKIIILYILSKNGISEENLNKLIVHAKLSKVEKKAIANLNFLGINVIAGGNRRLPYQVPRKDRINEQTYKMSRWTPVIKDIIERCIENDLNEKHFPFIHNRTASSKHYAPTNSRYGQWHKDKGKKLMKDVPRIILFVIGGISYSEIRCAYEVSRHFKNWEIIIGSSQILTPEVFLKNLSDLTQ